jgi:hypothetical protein
MRVQLQLVLCSDDGRPRPLCFSQPLDIEKRAPRYPRSEYQEHPVIQRPNPTSQLSVRLLHKPRVLIGSPGGFACF